LLLFSEWSNQSTSSVRRSPVMAGEEVEMTCDSEEPMAITNQVKDGAQAEEMVTELGDSEVRKTVEIATRFTPPRSQAIASSPSPLLHSTSSMTAGSA